MKKLLCAAALSVMLNAESINFNDYIDFTSFEDKIYTPLVSSKSPSALNNLYIEHKEVHSDHESEIEELETIIKVLGGLLLENQNLNFELIRTNKMILKYVQVKYTKVEDEE